MRTVANSKPVLEINLRSVQQNYLLAKNIIGGVNCSAVIKANAYGIGAREVFKTLKAVGCNDFYFAYFDEAYGLHDLFDGSERLYILAPQNDSEMKELLRNNFIPVLNSLNEVRTLQHIALSAEIETRCVLHFDTGMNRVGLNLSDEPDLNGLNVLYIMSHLACADEEKHPLNEAQLHKVKKLKSRYPTHKISFCNSPGMFLGSDYHFDQARPGCMLYGINPTPEHPSTVLPVASIYAKVVAVRTLAKTESISYGGDAIAKKGTRIATLAIGYADGYHRSLSGNAFCYFNNLKLPVLGRVTMDFIMVDITELPEQTLDTLNYMEVMGANITVDEIAKSAKTIGYEILTSLQNRFNRFYIS